MSLILRGAATPYLQPFTKEAPSGVIIGVIGDDTAAIDSLLRIAAGLDQPASGTVEATAPQRWLGPADAFILAPAGLMALFHTFSMHGALIRARAILGLERLRKSGATILLASHEQALLSELADEIWWIDSGQLIMSGDPGEVLAAYNGSAAARLREWSSSLQQQLAPSMRRGDGRAEIIAIELVGASGQPSTNWQSAR